MRIMFTMKLKKFNNIYRLSYRKKAIDEIRKHIKSEADIAYLEGIEDSYGHYGIRSHVMSEDLVTILTGCADKGTTGVPSTVIAPVGPITVEHIVEATHEEADKASAERAAYARNNRFGNSTPKSLVAPIPDNVVRNAIERATGAKYDENSPYVNGLVKTILDMTMNRVWDERLLYLFISLPPCGRR